MEAGTCVRASVWKHIWIHISWIDSCMVLLPPILDVTHTSDMKEEEERSIKTPFFIIVAQLGKKTRLRWFSQQHSSGNCVQTEVFSRRSFQKTGILSPVFFA